MKITTTNYEAFFLDYHEGNLQPQQVAELLLFVEQHPELRSEFESFENIKLDEVSCALFRGKDKLKKEILNITEENFDELAIRALEGDLSPDAKKIFLNYIEQHPHAAASWKLFNHTVLAHEPEIIFPAKESIRLLAAKNDTRSIAALEGLLSAAEQAAFDEELVFSAELQHTYTAYRNTVSIADPDLIYPDKDSLKRKERKLIPFMYYIAAAAAILLLAGLFFIFSEPAQAPAVADQHENKKVPGIAPQKSVSEFAVNAPGESSATAQQKKQSNTSRGQKHITPVQTPPQSPAIVLATNEQDIAAPKKDSAVAETKIALTSAAVTENESNLRESKEEGFMSLGQVVAQKIKEKTLDENALAAEKKAGRINRFNGWDLLRLIAKGASRITGSDIDVAPTYNSAGDITAYAFNAGKLGFSRPRDNAR